MRTTVTDLGGSVENLAPPNSSVISDADENINYEPSTTKTSPSNAEKKLSISAPSNNVSSHAGSRYTESEININIRSTDLSESIVLRLDDDFDVDCEIGPFFMMPHQMLMNHLWKMISIAHGEKMTKKVDI